MLTDEELLIIHQVLDEHIDNISDKSQFEGDFEETKIEEDSLDLQVEMMES